MRTADDRNSASPGSEMCAFGEKMLDVRFARMLAPTDDVRKGGELEPVKQMRVWSRRSRAALDVFRGCFGGRGYTEIERHIKEVTGALSAARDLDVMIDGLHKSAATLPEEQRSGAESFVSRLEGRRARGQDLVEKALKRLEKFDLLAAFDRVRARAARNRDRGVSRRGAPGETDGEAPLLLNAARCIGSRLDDMLALERYIPDVSAVRELHKLRIAAKDLRYTLELFRPAYEERPAHDEQIAAFIETMKVIQDHLGEIHDADVLVPTLGEHLARLAGQAHGADSDGEPIVGVNALEIEACEGLLELCRRARAAREKWYAALLVEWRGLEERRFFRSMRAAIDEAAHLSVIPDVLRPADPPAFLSVTIGPAPDAATTHGQDEPAPEPTASDNTHRPRRRQSPARPAGPGRHTRSGSDPDTRADEGGPG